MRTDGNPSGRIAPDAEARREWSTPLLVRLGSVAEMTSKVDIVGRNDGGVLSKKRT